MTELVWFRSYVEQLLTAIWQQPELVTDADGDYPARYGTAAVYVRVEAGVPMALRVTAHVAHGVKRSAKLLAELNDVTARSRFGSVYWLRGDVLCEYALPASAVDAETLAGILGVVSSRADELGELLTIVYGGQTPFESDASVEWQPDEDAA